MTDPTPSLASSSEREAALLACVICGEDIRERVVKVTLRFAWYDLWVGVFVDTAKRTIYVCPLPCVLITIKRRPLPPSPLVQHPYQSHRYVVGVCQCGWPPTDVRHAPMHAKRSSAQSGTQPNADDGPIR